MRTNLPSASSGATDRLDSTAGASELRTAALTAATDVSSSNGSAASPSAASKVTRVPEPSSR